MNLLDNKKRAVHHWWPKSLQQHWVNSNGQLNQRKSGIVEAKTPKNNRTGCRRNTHFLDVGDSPWSHSFEEAFNTVDSKGAVVVKKAINRIKSQVIYRISRARLTAWLPFHAAATDTKADLLSKYDIHHLARLVTSIVIRSPAFQFKKSFLHPAFFGSNSTDPELGKENIWQHWSDFYLDHHLPYEPVSIVFLISKHGQEFAIGDGFYQNAIDRKRFIKTQHGNWRASYRGAIIFPLSPDICSLILFDSDIGQRLAILSESETACINRITCESSRSEIYFRNQDQPSFNPCCEPNVRYILVNEESFLWPWIDTTH